MIPANDDAMSSIDLFMNSISKIILELRPKKVTTNTNSDKENKKSIKAKKVLKTTEVKKVSLKTKVAPKKSNVDKSIGDKPNE